jgi:hypothetical protein
MDFGITINSSDYADQVQNFDPIPAGDYSVICKAAEMKQTKAGNGTYIRAEFEVTGPAHAGRRIWMNFNIQNPNPQAESIGRQQLAQYGMAIGKTSLSNTDQMIGGQALVKVTIRPAKGDYGADNDIKGFKSLSPSALPGAAAPVADKPKAPWMK